MRDQLNYLPISAPQTLMDVERSKGDPEGLGMGNCLNIKQERTIVIQWL